MRLLDLLVDLSGRRLVAGDPLLSATHLSITQPGMDHAAWKPVNTALVDHARMRRQFRWSNESQASHRMATALAMWRRRGTAPTAQAL